MPGTAGENRDIGNFRDRESGAAAAAADIRRSAAVGMMIGALRLSAHVIRLAQLQMDCGVVLTVCAD